MALLVGLAGLALLAAACSTGGQSSYSDPFDYCRAVGTMDTPDARYAGVRMPDEVAQGLQVAMGLPTGTPPPPIAENSYWRCMDGKVYACTVGANLPCMEQANTDSNPTDGMKDYCKENPASDFIPYAVIGHNSIYDWRCDSGTPKVASQVATPDARGFLANYWYEIQGDGQ